MSEYDAFIDMAVETMAGAAGEGWTTEADAAWRAQADRLKALIREAREEWARDMPGEKQVA